MNEPNVEHIRNYLEDKKVQERVTKSMQDAHSKATVTISKAAGLFDFSESQLREWEKRGLLKTERTALQGDSKTSKGHRQFSPDELDKLALIKELLDQGYSLGEIPQNIDGIWEQIKAEQKVFTIPGTAEQSMQPVEATQEPVIVPPIDQLLDNADYELFWRFYATNALRLSLSLLAEYNPNTMIGLVTPLGSNTPSSVTTANIADLGECLIGWLIPGYSFYLLYTARPSFEEYTDFRMHPLQAMQDNTWTVVQRKPGWLNINSRVRTIIQRLLAPLYEQKQEWLPFFKAGQHSFSFPTADFVPEAAKNPSKRIHLTRLVNLAVSMGSDKGWRFACILTPNNQQLSLSERQLIVEAASENAPEAYKEKLEKSIIRPTDTVISVSMRAYQSGRICYRHRAVAQDKSILNYDMEQPIGSCIAVPIGGEEAKPLGVIYLASSQQDAFREDDWRLLRMIARMAQELLETYQTRFKVTEQLKSLIEKPALADQAFDVEEVSSETELIERLERLLQVVWLRDDLKGPLSEILAQDDIREHRAALNKYYYTNDVLTFYCFDVNDQTSLAQKYGEVMARNLSREVAIRARNKLKTLFSSSDFLLCHAYEDRFYVFLGGIPLDEARTKAWALKKELDCVYKIDALRFSAEQPTPLEMLVRAEITVRMGINCYPAIKAYELMQRLVYKLDPPNLQAAVVSAIRNDFDDLLKLGPGVWSWDPVQWQWIELQPPVGA
jgi:DNA-binding transcriptional MerR regulator/GGDEF domain-containing protein